MAEVPISCTTWTRRTRHLSIDLAPRGDKPGLAGTPALGDARMVRDLYDAVMRKEETQ